jgi:hypothetical protein
MFREDMPLGSGLVRSFSLTICVDLGIALNDPVKIDINYRDSPEKVI